MLFKLLFKSQTDLPIHNQQEYNLEIKNTEANDYSADRSVWMIWMGLVLVAVAALPFIARSPDLAGFVADLCLSIIP